MAQVTQRERKITLAINVNKAEELPQTADYAAAFISRIDPDSEYDVDLRVDVNASQKDEKHPIGFAQSVVGVPIEIELDEEEPDGLRIQ